MVGVDDKVGAVRLEGKDGGTVAWKPAEIEGLRSGTEVYRAEGIELRTGDRIRWTRNDDGLGLVNSRTAEVAEVKGGRVTFLLEDGRKLELGRGDPQLQTVTGERIAALEGIGEMPRETPDKGEEAEPVGPGERPVGDGSSSKDHELTVPGRESGASMGLGLWGFAIHLRGSSRQATDGTRIPD